MTFDDWWATLTPAERKVIGVGVAKFVWNAGYRAAEEALEKEAKEKQNANS